MVLSNVYEEVFEILSYMDKVTVMKIPRDILINIKTKRNINFKTKIDKNDIFNEENASKEAIDLLCWLDYNYWMSTEKKTEIDKLKKEKIKDIEEEKRNRYNPDELFKKAKKTEIYTEEQLAMVEYKEGIIKKILGKIRVFFKRLGKKD